MQSELWACQAKEGSEGWWNAKELHRDLGSTSPTRIASEPLLPTESEVCPLRPGEGRRRDGEAGWGGRFDLDRHTLLAHELDARPSIEATTPVTPQNGLWTNGQWMRASRSPGAVSPWPCHWHCSRSGQGRQLRMLAPYTTRRLPLASLRCSCRTSFWEAGATQRPIGLEGKVLAREAASDPARAHVRRSIARSGSRVR
jgi:hypothetical protein